jgi:threonine synthase
VVPTGNFGILDATQRDFESERVSDEQTIETIKEFYKTGTSHKGGYILDPHSAISVAAALGSMKRTSPIETHHIALATAHPAKFANTVDLALKDEKDFSFDTVLPEEFGGLGKKERRVRVIPKGAGWESIREIVEEEVKGELKVLGHNSVASISLRR